MDELNRGWERCGGVLKPDVVFFGESVPQSVVEAARSFVADSEVLLVLGSSFAVFSGYRFLRQAQTQQMPIAIVNLGATRGDDLANVRVDANLVELLPWLARALGRPAA
jgi:NAD-dependent SIR2 family protein deacetylase